MLSSNGTGIQRGETKKFKTREVESLYIHTYIHIYIRGSVHRNSWFKKSNEMQQYTDIYLLPNYTTCFGDPSRPSSEVHKTVVTTSGTDHTMWGASLLPRYESESKSKGNF